MEYLTHCSVCAVGWLLQCDGLRISAGGGGTFLKRFLCCCCLVLIVWRTTKVSCK